jgi:phosphate/sulfate permease
MVMIGNIVKFVAAVILGFLLGLLSGMILGLGFGLALGLFFLEIVNAQQTILMSILLSAVLGGLLGLFAIRMINKVTENNDNPFAGIATGIVVGVITAVFVYGYIDIPDPSLFEQAFYTIPMFYGVSVGGQIGAIIFPIFGAAAVVREIITDYRELRKNTQLQNKDKNELSFYRSQNSVDDV